MSDSVSGNFIMCLLNNQDCSLIVLENLHWCFVGKYGLLRFPEAPFVSLLKRRECSHMSLENALTFCQTNHAFSLTYASWIFIDLPLIDHTIS